MCTFGGASVTCFKTQQRSRLDALFNDRQNAKISVFKICHKTNTSLFWHDARMAFSVCILINEEDVLGSRILCWVMLRLNLCQILIYIEKLVN